jgi:very-short-patch-repair endonuclease
MVMAAVLAAGPGAVASHRTAAWLLGIPGFTARGIEVCRPFGRSARGAIGFVHRSRALLPQHVTVIDGIPCTRIARTLFDLAGIVHPRRTARALDNCLSRGMVTFRLVAELLPELARRGRSGTRLMRRLVAERGPRYVAPASELEACTREVLEGMGLEAERQVNLGNDHEWIGRVDFIVRPGVIVEADGRLYHDSLLDDVADRERDERLTAAGFIVVRVTWDEVVNRPWVVIAKVRDAIAKAAA